MKVIHKMSIEDILEGCINEDRVSQRRLYERFYGKMVSVCYRYTSNHDEACDILNNGFFKVFKNIKKYRPEPGKLEGWIYRIMVNSAIDHYRKEQKHKNNYDIDNYMHVANTDSDAISQLTAQEILELVRELTPAYRMVFSLYVVEGYSHAEIAEKLGISEGTSKSNLAKARMKLQKLFKERFKTEWKTNVK